MNILIKLLQKIWSQKNSRYNMITISTIKI